MRRRHWRNYTCAPLEDAEHETATDGLETTVDALRAAAEVRGKVATLPERERSVVALYYGQGLTHAAIAQCLHMCDARVSELRRQALARLRTDLAHLRRAA